ncbi:MAG TPA: PA containing protein [Pseudonocardia sp.]|jgi:chromosome segregation ATPase|nr:PA containing protein [Pseudonocardia sp.]
MSTDTSISFDRMRGMLMRAAEIRDSEQQQIFDSLDEIHARLAAVDALGTIRKRVTELPDRTEVGVLAERLDEAVAKLDAQDVVLATVARAVEALPDKLAMPFVQLDGRLDGMAGRLEGVGGRMAGLDDRLAGLQKRLDDLDNRLDRHELRLDALPGAVGAPLRERLDGVVRALDERDDQVRGLLAEAVGDLRSRLDDIAARPAVDPTAAIDGLAGRLETLAARLDAVAQRLDAVEDGLGGRLGELGGSLDERLARLDAAVVERPDATAVSALVERANEASERRSAGQLDEAMATFAELMLGRGPVGAPPPVAPRSAVRRPARSKLGAPSAADGSGCGDRGTDDPDA